MFSDLVQSLARTRKRVRAAGISQLGCLLMSVLLTSVSHAAWQDPLHTPAFKSQRAHETLMLDITRADTRLVAVGSHGHIVYSDDEGRSWTQGDVPVSVTLTAVNFVSGQIGWAVGHDGVILKSTDGAKTWTKQFDGFTANQAIVDAATLLKEKAEAALAKAEAAGKEAAIDDAAAQLEGAEFSLGDAQYDLESGSTKPFLDVWFYDANRGYALGAYGMFFYTDNGGNTWTDVSSRLPNPDRLHLNVIASVGGQSLVVVGEQGTMFRSDDLGQRWVTLDTPYDGSLFGILANNNTQLIHGLRGNLYRTTDGGLSWRQVALDTEQALLGGFVNSKGAVLVGNGGVVVRFDAQLSNPQISTVEGRKAYSGVVETTDGNYVLAGENGLVRLDAKGILLHQPITMASGDF